MWSRRFFSTSFSLSVSVSHILLQFYIWWEQFSISYNIYIEIASVHSHTNIGTAHSKDYCSASFSILFITFIHIRKALTFLLLRFIYNQPQQLLEENHQAKSLFETLFNSPLSPTYQINGCLVIVMLLLISKVLFLNHCFFSHSFLAFYANFACGDIVVSFMQPAQAHMKCLIMDFLFLCIKRRRGRKDKEMYTRWSLGRFLFLSSSPTAL